MKRKYAWASFPLREDIELLSAVRIPTESKTRATGSFSSAALDANRQGSDAIFRSRHKNADQVQGFDEQQGAESRFTATVQLRVPRIRPDSAPSRRGGGWHERKSLSASWCILAYVARNIERIRYERQRLSYCCELARWPIGKCSRLSSDEILLSCSRTSKLLAERVNKE